MIFQRIVCALACVVVLASTASAQTAKPDLATAAAPKTGPSAWDRVAGNWKLFKGKIQKQWGKLTKDDIAAANGRREELVGRIQARYGIDKAQADKQVDTWLKAQK